jgi:hypothetical protein
MTPYRHRLPAAALALGLLAAAGLALATQPGTPPAGGPAPALPPDLDRVPRDAAGFLTVNVGELWKGEAARGLRTLLEQKGAQGLHQFEQTFGLRPEQIERVTVILPTGSEPGAVWVQVTTAEPFDLAKVLNALKAAPGGPGGGRPQVGAGVRFFTVPPHGLLYPLDARTLILCPNANEFALAEFLGQLLRREPRGRLSDLLTEAAGRHTLTAGVNLPVLLRNFPPPDLTAARALSGGLMEARTALVTLDVGAEATLTARLHFADAEDARQAEQGLRGLLAQAREQLRSLRAALGERPERSRELTGLVEPLDAALKSAAVEQAGADLRLTMSAKLDALTPAVVAEAAVRINELGDRDRRMNNLKQLGLAFHNYESTFGYLPQAALTDRDVPGALPGGPGVGGPPGLPGGPQPPAGAGGPPGPGSPPPGAGGPPGGPPRGGPGVGPGPGFSPYGRPLLSWRVSILPFIEQEDLFKQFHLNEPWDSEHNKRLMEKMPKIYEVPGRPAPKGETFYQVFTGKDALFEGGKKSRIASIPDGTSNTIMIAEAGEAVPWTKPADMPFTADGPLPKLPDEFFVAMCDGSTRAVNRKKVSDQTLRYAIMPADGIPLGADWDK